MRHVQASGKTSPPGMPILAAALILGVVLIVPIINGPSVSIFGFLERYAGVVVLVALSNAVMFGLACTDRLVLSIRLRVLLQDIHRGMATLGVGFLAVHVITKVLASKAVFIEAFIPFVRSIPVGLGSFAGYLMVAVAATGVFRIRYLNNGKPWMWRLLHSAAYISWPVGIIHGLTAGRPAAPWVSMSYTACLVAVGLGLLVRFTSSGRRGFSRAVPGARNVAPRRGPATSPFAAARVKGAGGDDAIDAEFWASLRREVRR